MRYLIDTANIKEIEEALTVGFKGVTANPSMYKKEGVEFYKFLKVVSTLKVELLTAEVVGDDIEKLVEDCDRILNINKNIIIKVNFSSVGLKLIDILSKRGVKTACTLIFNLNQASLAINAGANYIFPFIGRNDENGYDGIENIKEMCDYIKINSYETKIIAASIKNVYHLKKAALCGCDYAAITYDLFEKACISNLTEAGLKGFEKDWKEVSL